MQYLLEIIRKQFLSKVNLRMVNAKVLEEQYCQMVVIMKESGEKVKKMVLEYINGLKGKYI